MEAKSDSGDTDGVKKQDNILKSIDVLENEKSMDSKSDIDGAEKQDNLSVRVDEPEEVDKMEAKSDSGDIGGAKKQDNIPKSIDVPENEKSMDSKSDIDGAEKQDNMSVSVDEPEEVDKVEAKSDSGVDKTECVIHDRTPEGEVSCEGIGYVKSGDSNIVTMCKWLYFVGFLILSCPKRALVWGNCRERLHVEIFVRVLHSSEVISLILCK